MVQNANSFNENIKQAIKLSGKARIIDEDWVKPSKQQEVAHANIESAKTSVTARPSLEEMPNFVRQSAIAPNSRQSQSFV